MFKNLSYRTTRALHICIVFSMSLLIAQLLKMPRGAWTGFTVILIYTGFDAGSSIQRVKHRCWGVILGLLLAHFILFIGHLNYRILLLALPALLGGYYYILGKSYAKSTIFSTILSVIGSDYFASTTFQPQWYIRDYFMCTLLAAAICFFFEYFIFRVNMTRKFYVDFQKDLIAQLENFLILLKKTKIKKTEILNAVVTFNQKIVALNTFTQNTQHDYHNKDNLLAELEQFNHYIMIAYSNIRKIYILHPDKHFSLLTETHSLINQLKEHISIEKTNLIIKKPLNA